MTEEIFKKEYCYEITPDGKRIRHEVGPSFMDIPGGVIIQKPICLACLLYDEETMRCDEYGKIPQDYRFADRYDCPHFKANKKHRDYKDVVKEIEKEKQA